MDLYCLSNTRLIENAIPLFMNMKIDESGIDIVHEFAARTCYSSLDRFGEAPGFLNSLVQRGHNDVFEHGMIQMAIDDVKNLDALELEIRRRNQYARIQQYETLFDTKCKHLRVFASFRVWSELATSGIFGEDGLEQIREILYSLAPKSCMWDNKSPVSNYQTKTSVPGPQSIELETGAVVTLIAKSTPSDVNHKNQACATVLYDGPSRALTHQLVRHRRGSFSQESQRYVSLDKSRKNADCNKSLYVTPTTLDFTSKDLYDKILLGCLQGYDALAEVGVKPEDARFVLPNAMRTKIVVTMTMDDWSHFFWLRALDNAAQWEIREEAQATLRLFEHHLYPFVLSEVDAAYSSGFFDEKDNFRKIMNALPIANIVKSRGAARRARKGKNKCI